MRSFSDPLHLQAAPRTPRDALRQSNIGGSHSPAKNICLSLWRNRCRLTPRSAIFRQPFASHYFRPVLMTDEDVITPVPATAAMPSDAAGKVNYFMKRIEDEEDADAMCSLAMLLQSGAPGVDVDIPRAVQLYQRGLEMGHAGCRDKLNAFLQTVPADPESEQMARELMAPQVAGATADDPGEDTDAEALCNLAMLLETGAEGIEADPARAARLYERAIDEFSNEEAMNNLAILLEGGADGVDADPRRAVQLYEQAIEEGDHTEAMFNLAVLLVKGADGVKKDAKRAVQLYTRAMDEGEDVDAMKNLAVLLQDGAEGVPADVEKANKIYARAMKKEGNESWDAMDEKE